MEIDEPFTLPVVALEDDADDFVEAVFFGGYSILDEARDLAKNALPDGLVGGDLRFGYDVLQDDRTLRLAILHSLAQQGRFPIAEDLVRAAGNGDESDRR